MMRGKTKKYVFGPVPSRRLGRSLGIDLVPMKTCSYNCLYCQIGRTAQTTIKRDEYAPVDEVILQLREALEAGAAPDCITVSGSGEPTLHSGIGEVIRSIKEMTDVPVAVITNGSTMDLAEVREALLAADIVMPDLDAGSEDAFRAVNRPHPEIRFPKIVEGLIRFSGEFKGRLWLEVFLVEGVNDSDQEVRAIAATVSKVKNSSVQINTVTRPPAEPGTGPVSRRRLEEVLPLFGPGASIIADYGDSSSGKRSALPNDDDVLEMVSRRPCTIEDIALGLGLDLVLARSVTDSLLKSGLIETVVQEGRTYLRPSQAPGSGR